jgi:chromosome segregation ATPase
MANAKKQLEEFQDQVQKMHSDIGNLESANENLKSHISELENKIDEDNKQMAELQKENESLKQSLLNTNEALVSSKKSLASMQLELEDRNAEIEANKNIIAENKEGIEKLEQENGQLRDDLENKTASDNDTIMKLTQQLDDKNKSIVDLQARIAEIEKNDKEIMSSSQKQEAKIKSLEASNEQKDILNGELKVLNYGMDQKIKMHELKEKSLEDTIQILNSANDNFKLLLEKYRFLVDNNMTVRKRTLSTKKSVKSEKK